MSELTDRLTAYAAYHRNPQNIRTHFIGIPLIALGTAALLYPAGVFPLGVPLNLTVVAGVLLLAYYYRLDSGYGTAMLPLFLLLVFLGSLIASMAFVPWLLISLMLLAVGWTQQLIGHKHEGRKPAFLDDLRSIPIGPLFVLAEAGFKFGWRLEVQEEIERRLHPHV